MYLAVFIFTTLVNGPGVSEDPSGPRPTLQACEERIKESAEGMVRHLSQFGLQEISAACHQDDSQAI